MLVVLTAAQLVFHVALDGGVADAGASRLIVAAHSAAALLTAVVLHRGEDACWRVADIVARPSRALRAVAVGALGFAAVVRWFLYVGNRRPRLCLVYAAPRRGPPCRLDSLITA